MNAEKTPLTQRMNPLIPSLAHRIVEMVRRDNLQPGHHLTELALCEELGVSRSPVRKALQFLEGAKVVQPLPTRGYELALAASDLASFEIAPDAQVEEEVYLRIANDRISGALEREFTESDLIERYGLARMQIQRILNRMMREGMVDRKAGRGWMFRPLLTNEDSHRESYRFRMIIEPASLLEPGYLVDRKELDVCKREQHAMLDGGIEKFAPSELFRCGSHFHETLVAGANNRFLLDSLKALNQMRRVVEYGKMLDRSRLYRQCEEHLLMIDLLERGERMEASLFLRQHLNNVRITKVGERT
jgi:DNA-binding GntR family transcriptional regulator